MTSSRSLAIWTVPPLTGSPVDRFTISPEVAALSVPFPCGRRSLDGLLGLRSQSRVPPRDRSRGYGLLAIAANLDRSPVHLFTRGRCSVGAFSLRPPVSGWAPGLCDRSRGWVLLAIAGHLDCSSLFYQLPACATANTSATVRFRSPN